MNLNEEYTLSEDVMTPAREKTMNAKLSKTDTDWQKKINASYAKHSRLHNSLEKGYHKIKNQIEKEKGSSKVYGKGGKIVKGYTNKTKKENTMQNEEYTQVLEQMILTLTGMKLEELHEAVVGHLSEDYQTPDREQETAGEMRRAQGNARRKAKAWRPGTSSRAYKQEGEFDHAVDKLTSKVSQVEKERRSRNVFGLGGKKVAKPGARIMSKISGQRGAQLAADQDDRDGKYMGDAEFSRSSDKATNLIAAAKKARTRL